MTDDIRTLLALASEDASLFPRKTDLELFIDFLREQGTIVNARPDEVEAEGHDTIRFFRPDGGLTIDHFDALVSVDPWASEMLARAVVENMLIDQGYRPMEVHWASNRLGLSFWDQVKQTGTFELASSVVESEIHKQRTEQKQEWDIHDESKINPRGDWSIIVMPQGTFALTRLARKVFPVIYREHLKGLPVNEDFVRRGAGIYTERIDRSLRSSKVWGIVVGPDPARKGFWRIIF